MAYPAGRITMVPRTGPLSASSALAITSWYQRGKSSARGVSTRATSAELSGSVFPRGPSTADAAPRSGDDRSAQDDPGRVQHGSEVHAGVLRVDHEGGEAALDEPPE